MGFSTGKEGSRGEQVTEPLPGIFFFDELGCTCPIFSFLSDSEGICLQAAALQLYFLAVSNRKIKIPLVESDLEQAAFYRLWGPYHGY
jgi:hypothetical protein